MKNICVIGTGYVGLVNGTCFADLGNNVITVDINEEKIERLKEGHMPIYEPGLADLVKRNTAAGRLQFTTSYEEGMKDAEFVFICVGTPQGVDGEADLRYVRSAAETIAKTMDHPLIVINKSTVPVGTGDWVSDIIKKNQPSPVEFAVVSCPEFLREGSAVPDFMQTLALLSPIGWAMDAFNELMFYGGSLVDVIPSIVVLTAVAAVLFGIGVRQFSYTD